jgi:Lrp/AsnC family transcriptional regulator
MIDYTLKIDDIDRRILGCLQRDGTMSQREISDQVGLSQNACWRRLQRLTSAGVLQGSAARLNLAALGLDLTVFVMIKTVHHADDWLDKFAKHVAALPQVTDFHRIGGEWDYLIKVSCAGMAGYDKFYRALITGFDLANVTGYFSMEAMLNERPVGLGR